MTPPGFRGALGYGAVGTAGGILLMLVTGTPAAQALLVALVVPALVPLGLAVTQSGRRRAWLRAAGGLLLGSALCVTLVLVVITGVANLLSDPA